MDSRFTDRLNSNYSNLTGFPQKKNKDYEMLLKAVDLEPGQWGNIPRKNPEVSEVKVITFTRKKTWILSEMKAAN